jgi:hypothetical protein
MMGGKWVKLVGWFKGLMVGGILELRNGEYESRG